MLLKLTSKFKPFSFDEMVKPLVLYKDTYDKVEEKYQELSMETEKWRDIVNETGSPEAYAMYKRYSDLLRTVVDDFATGMTMLNRSLLTGLRRLYASDIIPIENAKKAYDKMIDTREKIKATDDSAIFLNKYNSIDNFLHGNVADNSYISGNKVLARVAAEIENYAKSKYGLILLDLAGLSRGYIDRYVLLNGFSIDVYNELLKNNPTSLAAKDIHAIIMNTLNGVGYLSLDNNDKSNLYSYAMTGASAGLSNPSYSTMSSGKLEAETHALAVLRFKFEKEQAASANARANEENRLKKIDAVVSLVSQGANVDDAIRYVYGNDSISINKLKNEKVYNIPQDDLSRISSGVNATLGIAATKKQQELLKALGKTEGTNRELKVGQAYTGEELSKTKSKGIKMYSYFNTSHDQTGPFSYNTVVTSTDASPYLAQMVDDIYSNGKSRPRGSRTRTVNWGDDQYKIVGLDNNGVPIVTANNLTHRNYFDDSHANLSGVDWKTYDLVKDTESGDVLAISKLLKKAGVNPKDVLWFNDGGGEWHIYDIYQNGKTVNNSLVGTY